MKYFSRLVVVVELKSTGFHLALVFTASLSEVENGVKLCRICKTFWRIQTKLICCIEDFKVFAGNWTLVLCERNQSQSNQTLVFRHARKRVVSAVICSLIKYAKISQSQSLLELFRYFDWLTSETGQSQTGLQPSFQS